MTSKFSKKTNHKQGFGGVHACGQDNAFLEIAALILKPWGMESEKMMAVFSELLGN